LVGDLLMAISLPSRQYLASFSERVPGYLFPLFLLFLEMFLRFAFNLNTKEFIGPTLSATGVGMIMSLTTHKSTKLPANIPQDVTNFIKDHNLTIEPVAVKVFKSVCWALILVLTLLWLGSIILSTRYPNEVWIYFPAHYYPGFLSFIIGFILSEVKEVV